MPYRKRKFPPSRSERIAKMLTLSLLAASITFAIFLRLV